MTFKRLFGAALIAWALAFGYSALSEAQGSGVTLRSTAGTELGIAAAPLQVSLANTGANATAVKVDGSAVTQPVSGTFWQATQPVSGTVTANLAAGTNNIGDVDVLTVPADPFGANADAVVAAGAAGSIQAKLRRATQGLEDLKSLIVLAAGTNVIGKARLVDSGGTEATDVTAHAAKVLQVDATGATITIPPANPCESATPTHVVFNISTATTTQLIAASASNKNYICSMNLVVGAADNVGLIEDDTSACASPTAGMAGGTTAASGWNFGANGGLTFGDGGHAVFITAATNRYTCFITSSTAQLSGSFTYVQAP